METIKQQLVEKTKILKNNSIILPKLEARLLLSKAVKKNLIVLENKLMGPTWLKYINIYPKKYGVFKYDLFSEKKIVESELLEALEIPKKNFEKLIFGYNNVRPGTIGVLEIIKILKSSYVF